MSLPQEYRGTWRAWVDHDCGACIAVEGTRQLVVSIGRDEHGQPEMALAEHICELHNAWEREQLHSTGQLSLPEAQAAALARGRGEG